MEICDKIKIKLRECGMSQKDLAARLDMPMTTLSFYLTNKNKKPIPEKILKQIEIILNIDFSENTDKQEKNNNESAILKFLKLKPQYKEIASKIIEILLNTQDNE